MSTADVVFEALGWAGSLILIVSILQTRIDRLRWLNLVSCAVLVAYNLWLESWPMVVMNGALVAINLVNLVRLRRRPRAGRVAADAGQ
jgi:hypothetical protein